MTDGQLAALLATIGAALTAFGGLMKWCFTQWLADRKEDRTERKEDRASDREATIAVATAMTTMSLKFDGFERTLNKVADDFDEISGIHDSPPKPKQKAKTPAMGVRPPRPGTHNY